MSALEVTYRSPDGTAFLTRSHDLTDAVWNEVRRAARDREGVARGNDSVEMPWLGFLTFARTLRHLQDRYAFQTSYTDDARAKLTAHVREAQDLHRVQAGEELPSITRDELTERIVARGWDLNKRELKEEQVRDARRMLQLPNGANFSVPGAGKTTVALAVHLAGLPAGTKLLVVAPKNAFPAWDEVLDECLVDNARDFVRLVGGEAAIRSALIDAPDYTIISYAQLIRAEHAVTEFLRREHVHLILDESHRIKAGQTASAAVALRLGPLAVRRDLLTGTPMPQALSDLVPQFDFLWPAHGIGLQVQTNPIPRNVVVPLYVRTTKTELHLPEPTVDWVPTTMSDPQRLLYTILRDDLLRQLAGIQPHQLPFRSRASVMRLLQASIDPQVAVAGMINAGFSLPGTDFAEICRRVIEEDWSPRMDEAERRVRALTSDGRKVVIWTPFVRTIERLTNRFEDLGALAIHGGVAAGDEADDDTREGIIRLFHNDPSRTVLVANPAAGGEGISLHKVCHDAVYLGRTYNAAHYIQSRDRIHRLGLGPDIETRIVIVESMAPAILGSIDLSVRRRLQSKIDAMAQVLADHDLQQLSLEADDADPMLEDGVTREDLQDLVAELRRGAGDAGR